MKYIKTGTGIVFNPADTHRGWEYSEKDGRFVPSDMEDVNRLLLEETTDEATEKEFRTDIVCKTNNLIVWTEKARNMAKERHKGQKDKGGHDYFECHVSKVADIASKLFGGGYLPIIAYLHDILEDTETTETELHDNFPPEVVEAVITLTRKNDERYADYIQRVKGNDLAVKVKTIDLLQNLDLTRIPEHTPEDENRVYKRYVPALTELFR